MFVSKNTEKSELAKIKAGKFGDVLNELYDSGNTTNTKGAFYGIEKDTDINGIKPLFEYVVIIKLNEKYQPEFILELDWEAFFKHKHWHSRIGAYNLLVTNSLIEDGKMIYTRNGQ